MWRLTHQLFVHDRAPVLEGGMSTSPMRKAFQVIKGGTSGLGTCLKHLTINAFPFEAMKKALGHCVVVTGGSATPARYHAILLYHLQRAFTASGAPTIRVRKSTPLRDSDELLPFVRPVPPGSHPQWPPETILPPCVRTNQAQQQERATRPSSKWTWYPLSTSEWDDPHGSLAGADEQPLVPLSHGASERCDVWGAERRCTVPA